MSSRCRFAVLAAAALVPLLVLVPAVSASADPPKAPPRHHVHSARIGERQAHPLRGLVTPALRAALGPAAKAIGQAEAPASRRPATHHAVTAGHGRSAAAHRHHGRPADAAGKPRPNKPVSDGGKTPVPTTPQPNPVEPTGSVPRVPTADGGFVQVPVSSTHQGATTPPATQPSKPASKDGHAPSGGLHPLASVLVRTLSMSLGLLPLAIASLLALGGIGLVVLTRRRAA
jgi:hypothetical protein